MNGLFKETTLGISPPSHNLMDIPDEILEKILMFLSYDDVVSLTLVCQRLFHNIQNSSRLWKQLLWSMYPGASILHYSKTKETSNNITEELSSTCTPVLKSCHSINGNNILETVAADKTKLTSIDDVKKSQQDTDSPKSAKKLCLQVINTNNYWKRQFGIRHSIGFLAKEWLSRLSSKFVDVQEMSDTDMEEFLDLTTIAESSKSIKKVEINTHEKLDDEEKIAREFLLDALLSLIHDGRIDCELTIKYYATKVIRYVRNRFARDFWIPFMKGGMPEHEDYYKGLVHFSQWFQPLSTICIASVKMDVDRIAISTIKYLYSNHPKHAIFETEHHITRTSTSTTKSDMTNSETFRKYLASEFELPERELPYEKKEIFKILDALNYVMFEEEGFRGNTSNYYNPNNSYIDKVLETRQGIPITLCILYMLIAERLAIKLQPINFPRHFLLRLKFIDDDDTYVDVFQKGKRLTQQELINMDEGNTSQYQTAKPIEVFQRMVRNMLAVGQMIENVSDTQTYSLLRAALELQKLIGAEFEHPGFGLVQLYLQQNINHREVYQELDDYENWPLNMWIIENNQHLKQQVRNLRKLCMTQLEDNQKLLEENSKLAPKLRSDFSDVYGEEMEKYSVGMVMKHKRYHYLCVIYGWDAVCRQSKVWIRQMGVDRLHWKEKQPFYNVLVEDGSCRYAATENLFPAKPQRIIGNPQVGKYFVEFDENIGYIANRELTNKYPEDAEVQVKNERSWRKHRNSSSSNGEIYLVDF